jgi:hypothetical protein
LTTPLPGGPPVGTTVVAATDRSVAAPAAAAAMAAADGLGTSSWGATWSSGLHSKSSSFS